MRRIRTNARERFVSVQIAGDAFPNLFEYRRAAGKVQAGEMFVVRQLLH